MVLLPDLVLVALQGNSALRQTIALPPRVDPGLSLIEGEKPTWTYINKQSSGV